MGVRKEYNTTNPRIALFTKRFREEVDKRGGVTSVAQITGISRPTINYWYNGQRTPDANKLIQLSTAFNISADYLLGLSEAKNRDEKKQKVVRYTGLSEENAAFLNRMKGSFIPRMMDFILDDTRLDNGDDKTLIKLIRFFLEYDSGNHPTRRINIHGDVLETPIPKNGLRTDTIMLDEHIVENAVLEEIKNRLLKLKEGYRNDGEH